ncbi:hypothetical protein [Methanosarcina barkeri]|nr:hypothetical protein [Methanosarcina barkeri]
MDPMLSELSISNETTIKKLESLLTNIQRNISDFEETETSCFEKLNELSDAYCKFPFGPYTEVYYYTLKRPPWGSEFDVQIGSLGRQPDGWIELTQEQKNDFEKNLPYERLITPTLSEAIGELEPLIQEAIDRNSIIENLSNLEEQYIELKKLDERWVYLGKEFIDKYKINSVLTSDLSKASAFGYPYHSRLMAFYDALYHNVRLIRGKIKTSIRVLRRINYNLPFATVKGNGDDKIKSTINIGNLVQGDGNTLTNTSNYVNSGEMNLKIENKAEVEKLLQEFLKNLDVTDELDRYQKDDIAEGVDKIITELNKQPESQDRGLIDYRLKKIWSGVKDALTVSSSIVSIASALGISLS